MIIGIDHIQLTMPKGQEEKAREFYEHVLGLPEVTKPPQLAVRGGCWFGSGTVMVHLGVQDDFVPARKAHPAFLVTDLAALRKQLVGAGYEMIEDDAVPGVERFFTFDPFGNRLEFIQEGRSFG